MTSGVRRGLRWNTYSQGYSQIARSRWPSCSRGRSTRTTTALIGMAPAVFVTLVLIFSDLAFGTALIQRPEISEEDKADDLLADERVRPSC